MRDTDKGAELPEDGEEGVGGGVGAPRGGDEEVQEVPDRQPAVAARWGMGNGEIVQVGTMCLCPVQRSLCCRRERGACAGRMCVEGTLRELFALCPHPFANPQKKKPDPHKPKISLWKKMKIVCT